MKSRIFCFVIITCSLFILVTSLNAQDEKGAGFCYKNRIEGNNFNRLSLITPHNPFNILDYKISIDLFDNFISPYPRTFNAEEIVTFLVDTALNQITLDAVKTSLAVSSVGLSAVSYNHSSDSLIILLDKTYNPGDTVQVSINYNHLDIADNALYVSDGFVFTTTAAEGARKWFPCVDHPSDKAALYIIAKVPSTVKFGANGSLIDSIVTGDTIYYHWKSRDPIATYLMVLTGKVDYNLDIIYWQNPNSPNDSIPVRFYWNTGEYLPNLNNIKTQIIPMMTHFSGLFGDYPFEKNGFATLNDEFPWGGMENQTLVNLCPNCWDENLVSHEFSHMWFGDLISPATWSDVWLNESFATYCEALWYEYTTGYTRYKQSINSDASAYIGQNPGWPIYNPEWANVTPDINTLYNFAIVYSKGSCVLHMLRYTIGDSLFFEVLKSYAGDARFKYKNAATADFINIVNDITGSDYSWFFDQWVYHPNHPKYQNVSAITNNGSSWTVEFIVNQTQTNTVFFTMPLEIKIEYSDSTDTLVTVFNNSNNQHFVFNSSKQPVNVVFHPDRDIVIKTAALTSVDGEIPLVNKFELSQNYPNPFNPATLIRYNIPETDSKVELNVYDVIGNKIAVLVNEKQTSGEYEIEFDGANLSSGIYFYVLKSGSFIAARKMLLLK